MKLKLKSLAHLPLKRSFYTDIVTVAWRDIAFLAPMAPMAAFYFSHGNNQIARAETHLGELQKKHREINKAGTQKREDRQRITIFFDVTPDTTDTTVLTKDADTIVSALEHNAPRLPFGYFSSITWKKGVLGQAWNVTVKTRMNVLGSLNQLITDNINGSPYSPDSLHTKLDGIKTTPSEHSNPFIRSIIRAGQRNSQQKLADLERSLKRDIRDAELIVLTANNHLDEAFKIVKEQLPKLINKQTAHKLDTAMLNRIASTCIRAAGNAHPFDNQIISLLLPIYSDGSFQKQVGHLVDTVFPKLGDNVEKKEILKNIKTILGRAFTEQGFNNTEQLKIDLTTAINRKYSKVKDRMAVFLEDVTALHNLPPPLRNYEIIDNRVMGGALEQLQGKEAMPDRDKWYIVARTICEYSKATTTHQGWNALYFSLKGNMDLRQAYALSRQLQADPANKDSLEADYRKMLEEARSSFKSAHNSTKGMVEETAEIPKKKEHYNAYDDANFALTLSLLDEKDLALHTVNRALTKCPDHAYSNVIKASLLLQGNNIQDAVSHISHITNMGDRNDHITLTIAHTIAAQIYAADGNEAKMQKHRELAVAHDPLKKGSFPIGHPVLERLTVAANFNKALKAATPLPIIRTVGLSGKYQEQDVSIARQ